MHNTKQNKSKLSKNNCQRFLLHRNVIEPLKKTNTRSQQCQRVFMVIEFVAYHVSFRKKNETEQN